MEDGLKHMFLRPVFLGKSGQDTSGALSVGANLRGNRAETLASSEREFLFMKHRMLQRVHTKG
jgi:hypothetical protein